MDDKAQFEAMASVLDACAALPIDDRLLVLQVAWLALAKQARDDALMFPGGFPAVQARQIVILENAAQLVKEDTPDLELERLYQAGDWEGIVRYLRRLQNDLDEKGGA